MSRTLAVMAILAGIMFGASGCAETAQKPLATDADTENTINEIPTVTENQKKELKMVKVLLETSKGSITLELDGEKAPVTTENFAKYVKEGHFDGTIFHRVIKGFMVQGGGFDENMNQKKTHDPIVNEAANGLKNDRGTIAMARTSIPDSATCQFFINHADNDFLNYAGPANPGYAVFGKVTEGMDVVDAIAAVETGFNGGHSDVPTETITIVKASVID